MQPRKINTDIDIDDGIDRHCLSMSVLAAIKFFENEAFHEHIEISVTMNCDRKNTYFAMFLSDPTKQVNIGRRT